MKFKQRYTPFNIKGGLLMIIRKAILENKIDELRVELNREKSRLEKYIREHPVIRTKKEQTALEDLNQFIRMYNRLNFDLLDH